MSEKNKWSLPSGALQRHFGPIWAFWPYLLLGARWECPLIFIHSIEQTILHNISKNKNKIGAFRYELCPFESTPGHPIPGLENLGLKSEKLLLEDFTLKFSFKFSIWKFIYNIMKKLLFKIIDESYKIVPHGKLRYSMIFTTRL